MIGERHLFYLKVGFGVAQLFPYLVGIRCTRQHERYSGAIEVYVTVFVVEI